MLDDPEVPEESTSLSLRAWSTSDPKPKGGTARAWSTKKPDPEKKRKPKKQTRKG